MSEEKAKDLIIQKLKQILENNDINQNELGKIAEVSESAVSKWISGDTVPRMGALSKIAKRFNLDVSYFFHEEKQSDDDELAQLMEELHKNPDLRILMSTSSKVTPESLKALINLAQNMKEKED